MTYDEAFGLIGDYIAKRQAVWGPPGVAIAITDREQTLWAQGFGLANVESQAPVTEQSLFQIGSVGKSFTAFLMMQEVEAGRIGLHRPVKDVLDWFDVKERIRPINVEDLLTHASGLSSGTDSFEAGMAEALTMVEFDPGFAPGSGFLYSNLGFKILGLILERINGRRYPDLVRERILAPLGMTSSFGEITGAIRTSTVPGYRRVFTDRPAHASHPLMQAAFTESDTADGCISSTLEDMARYVRVFANQGGYPGGQLVSPESFEIMTRAHNTDPDTDDKLGFGIWTTPRFGRPILEHTGGMVAHTTQMSVDPASGIGLVILGNAAGTAHITDYARGVLCDVASGSSPRAMPPVDVRVIPDPEGYRGIWRGGDRTLSLTPDGQFLVAEIDGQRVYTEHRYEGALLIPIPGWDLCLLRPSRDLGTGKIASLTHGSARFFPAATQAYLVSPAPDLEPMVGLYRTATPWMPDIRIFQREGTLFIQEIDVDGGDQPGDTESELVPQQGQRVFRIGIEDWKPDRIRFGGPVLGKTQLAYYLNCPFGRVSGP